LFKKVLISLHYEKKKEEQHMVIEKWCFIEVILLGKI